jgi:tetratricopeptide (TPR) repeat protein
MIDGILGQWMRRASEDGATLIVNSDHGFKWSSDRPCEESSLGASMSGIWHRLDGVFAAWGARVRPSPERGTASVFDLAPTVAALLDVPIDRRASGRVLSEAFVSVAGPPPEDLFGRVAVRRVQAENLSAKDVSEYARRLQSLGYLSGSEPEKLAPTGGQSPGLTEVGWNNLGVYLRDNTKDRAGAEAAFRKAIELAPKYATPRFNLAVLDRMRGDDRAAIDELFRSFEAGHAQPEATVLFWYVEYQDRGKAAIAQSLLERGARAYPGDEAIARELALQRYRARDCPGAWESVARFEPSTRAPDTLNALALIQTCLGHRTEAAALFRRSLAIRPDQPGAIESLRLLEKVSPPSPGGGSR